MITTLFLAATMFFSNPTDANTTNETIASYEKASFNDNNFAEWVNDRLVYPTHAKLNDVEGTVYVVFTVDRLGNVINAKVDKGVNEDLDKEALRVISLSPRWKPAKQNGETIETTYRIGINFQLS